MNLRWTTTYTEIAHAEEEGISDRVRKAYWVIVAAWFVVLVVLGVFAYGDAIPLQEFLLSSLMASVMFGVLYASLVCIRVFAHAHPDKWHSLNWIIIWTFLVCVMIYNVVGADTEGALLAASVLVCVFAYRWLMHHARFEWEITKTGVLKTILVFGHKVVHATAWKEVRRHRVHPLSGAVELRLKWHHWHLRPRVHLIVPDKRHRKEIHAVLARILKRKR